MKKKFFMAGIILLVAAACSKESVDMVNNAQMEEAVETVAPVRVHVSDFAVEMLDFSGTTRAAQNVGDYNGVKVITLAFYAGDGTEQYKTTQVKGRLEEGETFGEFSTSLPMGSYTMVVLAHGKDVDDALVLTSPTAAEYTGEHTRETFAYTQEVNITNGDAVELSATLNRIVSKLVVNSTDGRTANLSNIRMTFSAGGKAFSPTTGLATVNTGFAHTVGNSKAVGQTTSSTSYIFLATDEQNIDVTIETLDADGNTLFSKTVENVPFKRNRSTVLTGVMYTNDALSGAFQVETAWLSDYNVAF